MTRPGEIYKKNFEPTQPDRPVEPTRGHLCYAMHYIANRCTKL